jgi:hypothetical protein
MKELPPWGTKEALLWGIAHPDWPWHTAESRREYQYPDGTWWQKNRTHEPVLGWRKRKT